MANKKKAKKNRKKQLVGRIVIFVLLLLCLIGIIFMIWRLQGKEQESGKDVPAVTATPTPESSVTPEATPTATPSPTPETSAIDTSELYSKYAVLYRVDGDEKELLLDVKGDERMSPASMTKMMTALVLLEQLGGDLNQEVTVDADMFDELYAEQASLAGFSPDEVVPAIDLLYGVMLPSGGECSMALARKTCGSEEALVDLMNQKAQELGMEDTHFVNVTGLYDPDHYSTAKDIATLLQYALQNDQFRQIFETDRYSTSSTNKHPDGITFKSSMFSKMTDYSVNGGEIRGGKTGYHDEAGLCLASEALIGGEEYILVTAGAEGSGYTNPYHIMDAFMIYNQVDPDGMKGTGEAILIETEDTDEANGNAAA